MGVTTSMYIGFICGLSIALDYNNEWDFFNGNNITLLPSFSRCTGRMILLKEWILSNVKG
jgi:hypothetical protein